MLQTVWIVRSSNRLLPKVFAGRVASGRALANRRLGLLPIVYDHFSSVVRVRLFKAVSYGASPQVY